MFRVINIVMCFVAFLSGCSDYNLSVIPTDPKPEIVVTPEEHNFGALDASGYGKVISITISNVGDGVLTLYDASLVDGD